MANTQKGRFTELKSDFTRLFLDNRLDFFAKRSSPHRFVIFSAAEIGLMEIPKEGDEDSNPFGRIGKPVDASRNR